MNHSIIAVLAVATIAVAGCGTSDPMVNPAQTLPSEYVDRSLLPPEKQYNWTDYHYGYWQFDHGIGWAWVPGYFWSPAQVVWYTAFEYDCGSPLPPPDLIVPLPGEARAQTQARLVARGPGVRGSFDRTNLHAILDKVETRRMVATTRELLRADLSLDFPLSLFGPESIAPPGPPPVPHFVFGIP